MSETLPLSFVIFFDFSVSFRRKPFSLGLYSSLSHWRTPFHWIFRFVLGHVFGRNHAYLKTFRHQNGPFLQMILQKCAVAIQYANSMVKVSTVNAVHNKKVTITFRLQILSLLQCPRKDFNHFLKNKIAHHQ